MKDRTAINKKKAPCKTMKHQLKEELSIWLPGDCFPLPTTREIASAQLSRAIVYAWHDFAKLRGRSFQHP
jgi:hypothetical protein